MKKYVALILTFLFLSGCVSEKTEKEKLEKLPEVYLPEEKEEIEIPGTVKKEEVKEEKKEVVEETVEEKKEEEKKDIEGEKEEVKEEKREERQQEIVLLPKEKGLKKEEEPPVISKIFLTNYLGECLIYELKWDFVNLGKAIFVCLEEKDRYRLIGITLPNGIPEKFGYGYNRVDSFIDKKTGKPFYFYQYSKSGSKKNITEIYFNWSAKQYTYISRDYKAEKLLSTKKDTIKFDADVFDYLTLFYFLRNADFKTFANMQIPIASREKMYIKIEFKGKSIKKLPNGENKMVYIIQPFARKEKESFKKGLFDVWITDDCERSPVYFEGKLPIGRVSMSLTKVRKIDEKVVSDVNKILEQVISIL
ncbi:MAG: DUF3108 domain-containing protein [Candidatus Omnitrophica bacterium]|nr:DUF3108 domain-containing protein [Candidatus Omnitrophota bacterium]MCM8802469.1 DUF3108 domain-containing protein [Candidatus Omnitrophota bacterium]